MFDADPLLHLRQSNAFGQLGMGGGNTTDQNAPVPVAAGGVTFTQLSAYDHTCGTTPAGALLCWGASLQH